MDYELMIFLLTGALVSVVSAQTRQYHFVSTPLNWTEAQSFCRQVYTDLATIENTDDVSAVNATTSNYTGQAWIGLYDDLVNSWRWSLNDSSFYGEGETEFRNWFTQQPNNLEGQQYCVRLLGDSQHLGTWDDTECHKNHTFVCYNGTLNGTLSFVKVDRYLNWTEAQRFCRENYVDLVSIRNQTENDIITNITDGNFVWIGLHREKLWSDGSTSLFRHWASGQPNSDGEQCVTTSFNDSGLWSDDSCSLSFPFICFRTIPPNAENFRSIGQDETSITLQWNKVNNNVSFILQFNGSEINITAPDGDGPVTHTVSSLTAGTKYSFTLFSVLENVRSSGVNITAVTAPLNAENFRSTGQDETSITLQWNKVNNNVSFILQFNGTEINITAPDGDGPVTHTVSSLTAGTKYTFTLFSVFENIRSSGVNITTFTAPLNAENFRSTGQDETSITLQWNKVNNNVSFILQFNGTEINITAPDGDGPVTHTVSSLTAGTKYTFTLFSVFENVRSSGVNITAVTAPLNAENFRSTGQDVTSITLQWNKVNNNVSFILQFNGTEINITAPDGDGPVTHTVSSLTAGTKYTFTLFSVFENIRSSGVNITAVTAPPNAGNFISTGQDETSITLQWNKVNNNVSFILQFNGTEINITAPGGDGPVTHTVSSLTAGTKYTFTLFSVFENVRSSGVNITAVTAPLNAENFRSTGQDVTSITLQWNKVNNNVSFILQFNGTEINITAPDGDGPVTHTVSSLTAGTKYTFTLFSVFENIRSSGVNITAVTAPPNAGNFISTGQDETSITLQWNKVNNNVSFILQFNGTEINITAPDGDGPVTHTVSSLTAGTKYTFTLFSVFENVRSSGVNITAVTAPLNAENFRSTGQDETSITLQWNKVNNNVSFILQFNGSEINITAPDGDGPVTHTVSSLTAGTKYTFTLFSVFENVRSSGVNITAVTAPLNAENFRSTGQDVTSITLQWNKVNNNVSFILQFNGTEINITAPDGDGPVTHTVSSLTAGTKYTFTLFSVFENVRSSGVNITAVTAPLNAENFRSTGQDETSITLQWNKVNNNVSFILQFNGTEINITAPDGDGPVTHTVSSLTAGTKYTFTLFSVFENVRSSGVNITAVTAPLNAENFRSTGQDETSITLQWNKVNNNVSFILQFNGSEINITAPDGDGPVTHTVSSLTAGTKYTFTLFSVFENVRSSGVNITAVTVWMYLLTR
ncbi:receptor-type tyrosine-protein phosphatase eta-like [Trachinotus anak]|uniref:receptor-type tyrosine-protein phosphatase eta-like n=1 Tax=Trachinotus anak TaxID=443729 RepID=UPI0039F25E27